jgi:trehalose-6-phosphate synthase
MKPQRDGTSKDDKPTATTTSERRGAADEWEMAYLVGPWSLSETAQDGMRSPVRVG